MEAIGAASALITLVGALSTVAEALIDVVHGVQDAPGEMAMLATHLLVVKAELEQLQSFGPEIYQDFATSQAINALNAAFEGARTSLVSLHKSCCHLRRASNSSLPGRLRWAYIERPAADKLLKNIRNTESSLSTILNLLTVRGQMKAWNELKKVEELLLANTEQIPCISSRNIIWTPFPKAPVKIKSTGEVRSTNSLSIMALGIHASSISTTGSLYTTHSLALRFKVPISVIFGTRLFTINLAFQRFRLSSSTFSLLPQSGFSIGTIVQEDSPIMLACKKGDLQTAQLLFQNHRARPDDVTANNITTMKFAIDSGNAQLVKCLLDNGVPVNRTFGQYQTSALQWAINQNQLEIVRLLLSYGACAVHICTLGWTPAFWLWTTPSKRTSSMAEYIDTFGNSHSLEWEVFDNWGWTVLHRAAAFGTADDIETLIKYGASPTTPALPLRWTALHHSVFYENVETFLFFIDPRRNVCIHSPDARGWTLLHIAASAGHDAIVRHLLSLGANHKSLSQPYGTHMPDELLNKSFTPGRAALAQGLGRFEQYISALRDFGLEEDDSYIREMDKEGSDDDDIFVDAEEMFYGPLQRQPDT